MNIDTELFFHQLCDTQFPTGAFSQSFGFEYFTFSGEITNTEDFKDWLIMYLEQQLVYNEGLAICFVYRNQQHAFTPTIKYWSDALFAQIAPEEVRYGSIQMGKQFLKLICQLITDPNLIRYQNLVKQKNLLPHPAVVFCLSGRSLNIDLSDLLKNYYYMTLYNLVQNAVRGIPIGQTSGQQLILALHPIIIAAVKKTLLLPKAAFGRTAPGLEIAQMNHHFLYSRSFMS